MGSSQAAGYIDMHGHIMGWLNELCFAPLTTAQTHPSMSGQAISVAVHSTYHSNAYFD